MFFVEKFAKIIEEFEYLNLPSDWPGTELIEEMTAYAAGSFIWADMVVENIGEKSAVLILINVFKLYSMTLKPHLKISMAEPMGLIESTFYTRG